MYALKLMALIYVRSSKVNTVLYYLPVINLRWNYTTFDDMKTYYSINEYIQKFTKIH